MNPAEQIHDVIVIGAGPAGCVAGSYAAKSGLNTLILERESFPRFAIGESLLPYGNAILKELGVWSEMERLGFVKKFGADFSTGKSERSHRFWFRKALGDEHDHTYQVERATFDALLLDTAKKHGCAAREGVSVTSVRQCKRNFVELDCKVGSVNETFRAKWVVDAGGRRGIAGTALGIPKCRTRKRRMVAIYGHFRNVHRDCGEAAGNTVIARIKEGWFWLIPLADGITSVGAVVPPEVLRGHAGDLDKTFDCCVEQNPELQSRLVKAEKTMPLRATADYSWRFKTFAKDRVLLAGDAAGFVDPIFSSGVMLAMKSGQLAASQIVAASQSGRALKLGECARYTRRVAGWMKLYGRVIQSFYERSGFEILMHPVPVLQIPKSIGYLVGGRLELSLADHVRIAGFRFVCLMQRVLNIAPSIPSLR